MRRERVTRARARSAPARARAKAVRTRTRPGCDAWNFVHARAQLGRWVPVRMGEMFTRSLLALTLLVPFAAGCDSKTDDKKAETKTADAKKAGDKKAEPAKADEKKAEPAKAEPAPAAEPAAGGGGGDVAAAGGGGKPVDTNPKDLFAEFTKADANVLDLMTKYEAGATFSGKLVNVAAEESGTPVLFVDVDGKAKISLGLADPKPFADKKFKVGDEIKVTCKIGGAMDNLMQVTDCTLAQ